MRCPRCKTKITDDSVFCSECGCKLPPKGQGDHLRIIIMGLTFTLVLGAWMFGKLLFDKHNEEVEAERARREAIARYEQPRSEGTVSSADEARSDSGVSKAEEGKDAVEIVGTMDVDDYLEYGAGVSYGDSTSKGKKEDNIDEKKSEYIIEDSASRYLTDADVKGLTLQEINYAKNEIYARHGRRFKSQELQDYFDSTSWYVGKYSPEDFDQNYSGRVLNDFEKKNADFLSEKEFAIAPNGYQLDAN